MFISFDILKAEFKRILRSNGFDDDRAGQCAQIFAENSRDGVHSHGANRFPTFVQYVQQNLVVPSAEPTREAGFGAIERWDGHLGPGMLNARFCMDRAIGLAKENGIGCVAIRNTSHWMRGGTYGWQAAEAGMIGICFTNTIANMPPWGGIDPRLGNNPLVIGVPREKGHIVLDMAISQYSIGKLNIYKNKGEPLPLPGGYDAEGNLTTDAAAILQSERVLPIGFWKGSGLSLMLDLVATVLSQGQSTGTVTKNGSESGVSQVFICMQPGRTQTEHLVNDIIAYTKSSRPLDENTAILYPGENVLRTRERSMKEGVWVDDRVWEKVKAL